MVAILVPMKIDLQEDQIILAQRSPARKRSSLIMVCLLRESLSLLYIPYNLLSRTVILVVSLPLQNFILGHCRTYTKTDLFNVHG